MRIATWNVNSLRIRLTQVCHWLDTVRPDLVLLQETKVDDDAFPFDPFLERGYLAAVHGQKSYNGVAILSRHRLSDISLGLPDITEPAQCRILAVTVNLSGQPEERLRVISAYVPNGSSLGSEKFAYKKAYYRRLTTYLVSQRAQYPNLVLGGDFNIAAGALDVDDPVRREGEILFTADERQWLAALQQESGLQDALRVVEPAAQKFSWWDYRAGAVERNHGLRIDYLFVSPLLVPRLASVDHFTDQRSQPQPSDHIPVMLTLND